MTSKANPPTSFNVLQRLAERDPVKFLKLYPSYMESSSDPADKRRMKYLQARAFAVQGKWEDAETTILEALAIAVEMANPEGIARCNLVLAEIYAHSERQERCLPCLNIAMETARSARDNLLISECLARMASYHLKRHDRANCLKNYTMAIRFALDAGEYGLALDNQVSAGMACQHFNDYTRALEFYAEALATATTMADPEARIIAINRLASAYTEMNRYNDADSILQQGLEIANSHSNPLSKLRLLFSLACLKMTQDLIPEAISCFHQCRDLADSIDFRDPLFLLELNSNLAGCHGSINEHETALRYITEAENLSLLTRNVYQAKDTALNKASLLLNMGRLEESRAVLKDVIRYFSRHKLFPQIAIAKTLLARYYEQRKDYPHALSALRELNSIYRDNLDRLMQEKVKEYDIRVNDLMRQNEQIRLSSESLAKRNQEAVISGFVGSSPKTQKVLESALAAANHPGASVLITGESGTGKEVVANLIHLNSIRGGSPFVAVNVSAISAGLVESEFFGHRKGSFTGATANHTGYFEQAHRGTLYLDEIADMPIELQSKLLRVLETRAVTPVGGSQARAFDFRVISSTNRDLSRMIDQNSFRLDLYHRLNTIEIHIPPLRERPDDIPDLVQHYTQLMAKEMKLSVPLVEDSFYERLHQYQFPGNVRELRNIVERLLIMLSTNVWNAGTLDALPSVNVKRGFKAPGGHISRVRDLQKNDIIDALQACGGKQKDAARRLGMSEPTLTRRIKALHLEVYTRKGR